MSNVAGEEKSEFLSFLPGHPMTAGQFQQLLREGPPEKRAWAISQLLRYAPWEEIWTFVSRDEVREIFDALDLPGELRGKWARALRLELPVG